jgi:hypothetical protein
MALGLEQPTTKASLPSCLDAVFCDVRVEQWTRERKPYEVMIALQDAGPASARQPPTGRDPVIAPFCPRGSTGWAGSPRSPPGCCAR